MDKLTTRCITLLIIPYLEPYDAYCIFEISKEFSKIAKQIDKKELLKNATKCRQCKEFYGKPVNNFYCSVCWEICSSDCIKKERGKYHTVSVATLAVREKHASLNSRYALLASYAMSDDDFVEYNDMCREALETYIITNSIRDENKLIVKLLQLTLDSALMTLRHLHIFFGTVLAILKARKIITDSLSDVWSIFCRFTVDPHKIETPEFMCGVGGWRNFDSSGECTIYRTVKSHERYIMEAEGINFKMYPRCRIIQSLNQA